MIDDPKKTVPEDEYQFPQDEYDAKSGTPPEESPITEEAEPAKSATSVVGTLLGKIPFLRNKRVLIVIVIAIAGIIFLRFVDRSAPAVPSAPVAQQLAAPAIQPPADTQMLNAVAPPIQPRTEDQIKTLQAQVNDMQNALSQSQSTVQTLSQTVSDLNSKIDVLSDQLARAMTLIQTRQTGERIVYHLRAVVPDRAWITTTAGQSQTVTLGDYIKQYGTVTSIDARQGVILTSSGRKIQYGTNDR